ncbi:MAG TPA: protein kinase [Blastocatellia bacterium]|nr:protein kinase [Blastocatellia bacterium]
MIGRVVGSYKILDLIGQGGMGAVFKGIDMMLEREVAVKVLRSELSRQPEIVERFRVEAVTLAKLNHPNIATLFSFLREGDDYFMVMEFVRGETLDDHLRRIGRMEPSAALALFCQALEGIDHAHRMGIVHRDIKAANMMLTETGSIKVMDFGIARVLGSARLTRQGSIVGTIEYMSPEQVMGLETDSRSDIYSLGILLYEMLTGRVPFTGETEYQVMQAQVGAQPPPPRTLAPWIPPHIEYAILKALAKRPEDRFGTAAEFRGALLAGTQPQAQPYSTAGLRMDPVPGPAPQPGAPPISTVASSAADTLPLPPTVPPPGQPWPQLYGSPVKEAVKETRLPGPVGTTRAELWPSTNAGQAFQPGAWQPGPGLPQFPMPARSPSLFQRLNWKHYAAAFVLLIIVLAAPFVVILIARQDAAETVRPPNAGSAGSDPKAATGASAPTMSQSAPAAPLTQPSPPPLTGPGSPIGAPAGAAPGQNNASTLMDSPAQKALAEKAEKKEAARKQAEAAKDKARRHAEAERALDQ